MSWTPSMGSTEPVETFSAGRFAPDCEMPLNLSLWSDGSDVTGENNWMMEVDWFPGKVFYFQGEKLRAPGFPVVELEKMEFALRFVCHLLVDHLDAKGLPEACQSLAEFYKYYRPAEEPKRLLCEGRSIDATLSERLPSPPFLIGEE